MPRTHSLSAALSFPVLRSMNTSHLGHLRFPDPSSSLKGIARLSLKTPRGLAWQHSKQSPGAILRLTSEFWVSRIIALPCLLNDD